MRGPQAGAFERAIDDGQVVVFPSDTVYGLACDPSDPRAIERLYALKGRPPDKAAAIMFFDLEAALAALPELGERTRLLLKTLLPGPLTVLLPNPARRFALACGADLETLGVRVVAVPELAGAHAAVLQSSANFTGEGEASRIADLAPAISDGADLVVDGGELPGVASTVLDLRSFERDGSWQVVRPGPISEAVVAAAVAAPFHFDPASYGADVIDEIHDYDELQTVLVGAVAAVSPARLLELGVGTGETTLRLLDALPGASVVGTDGSPAMLAAAAERLPRERFNGRAAMLQEPLPVGSFDAVASALAVHHLDGAEKADLFRRIREALGEHGRFVLADVVLGDDADRGEAHVEVTDGYDKPSTAAAQVGWLRDAGFAQVSVVWQRDDLAVIVADVIA